MPIFGRKKPTAAGQRWPGYPDTLDVAASADVDWIKQSNDPLVWHDSALACLIFRGDPHGLLAWLVEQSDLDRVTAAAIFLHRNNGIRRLTGERVEVIHVNGERQFEQVEREIEQVLDRLCALDGARIWDDHGIGLDPGWEEARVSALASLADSGRTSLHMLAKPIDVKVAAMPYSDIGEGELVSDAYMRREMAFLF